ncbi:hypothetical protein [Streptomyces sp. AK02-01A]|uniref:hypothetical protein n=1 Tax=Streptomyces sp. AK02-01A TaxID=3028648 RepID=UPI0029A48ED7|nr:hypothetical protein [Streptomyces sp. AK02-01A]MDX3850859.1 hypothetical protein [Streptomyces sp. AK02-01A]
MALNGKWADLLGDDSSGTRTVLASAGTHGGGGGDDGGGPDLKAGQGPWTSASAVAGELHTSSAASLTELDVASDDVGGGTRGFASTAALEEARTSWTERLTSVRDECSRLEGALRSAGKEFGEQETKTKERFAGGGPR